MPALLTRMSTRPNAFFDVVRQDELTAEQAEKMLLARLQDPKEDRQEAHGNWRGPIVVRNNTTPLNYLRQVIAGADDIENKAASVLAMGQAMEQLWLFLYAVLVRFPRES